MPVGVVHTVPSRRRASGDADWVVSTDGLTTHLTCRSGRMTVRLVGDVDSLTLPALEQALDLVLEQRPTQIVVDASGMSFCGVRGLAALIALADRADRTGTGYAVGGLSASQRRLVQAGWPHCDVSRLHHPTAADAAAAPGGTASDGTASAPSKRGHSGHLATALRWARRRSPARPRRKAVS